MAEYRKPTLMPASRFDVYEGGKDPALLNRLAHESAQALLARVRSADDPAVLAKVLAYTDEHGIDAVAELWSAAPARTLPGTLWRIYLVRALIGQDAAGTSLLYRQGVDLLGTIDPVVAGASAPTGPEEIMALAEEILRGVFHGDFAIALDRAASFCRLVAAGSTAIADGSDLVAPERATELTRRAARLSDMAQDLAAAARLWRSDSLD